MNRRVFLCGTISAALAIPLAAGAQQATRMYRVGLIDIGPDPATGSPTLAAFREGLRDRGWVDGQNIIVDRRLTEGDAGRIPEFVADFARSGTDVIVTISDTVLETTARVSSTIPIVSSMGGNPVRLGVATSLAKPGGNVTGLMNDGGPEVFGKGLELLKEAAPGARRLAVLWDAGPL